MTSEPIGKKSRSTLPIKYSLVIATLHDDGDLAKCLGSLAQLEPGPGFEVIIVDQNGDDRLVELVSNFSRHFDIQHERVAFRGASRARNLGASLARGEWLGFPDDDCELMPNILREVDLCAADPKVKVVTGQTVDPAGAPNVLRWGKERQSFTPWTMFGCLTEATLFVKRDVFLAAKGFDERFGPGTSFPAAEGIDLMNRMFSHLADGIALYNPGVQMRHPTKTPPWNAWAARRFHSYAVGDGALIAKKPQPHIVYWGLRTVAVAILQACIFRGWISIAHGARLVGLVKGFFSYHLRSRQA